MTARVVAVPLLIFGALILARGVFIALMAIVRWPPFFAGLVPACLLMVLGATVGGLGWVAVNLVDRFSVIRSGPRT